MVHPVAMREQAPEAVKERRGGARVARLTGRWQSATDTERLLQVVQPALIGLIDGTISTLAPIFAMAYAFGSKAALLAGLAAAFGAA
ncbi:MAG: iron exporter MbfA, partial [Thermoleophilaceae bacterium]